MLRKILSRPVLISAAALITMVLVFITTVDRDDDKSTVKKGITVRGTTARQTTPAASNPETVAQTKVVPAQPAEPAPTKTEPPKEVTYEEAETAFLEKNYDLALELFTRYTECKNENPWGFYMLGLSAWKAEAHEIAEESFTRALELDPGHVKSRINLSRVFLDMSRPAEALIRIGEVLEIDPESNAACRLQGRAYYQMDKNEDAVAAYRRAIQLDDNDAWSMNNLALILIEEGLYDEALPPLARAVELRNDVAIFQNNLGMALEQTGHFRAAEEAYSLAVAIDGNHENAANNLARIEGVLEEPGLAPVDMVVLARDFIEQIESWSVAGADGVIPDQAEPEIDTVVLSEMGVSKADSTDNDLDI